MLNDFILVRRIKKEQKVAGLVLTDATNVEDRFSRAVIVSVPDAFKYISEGSVIRYMNGAGHDIDLNGEVFRVIRGKDLVSVE